MMKRLTISLMMVLTMTITVMAQVETNLRPLHVEGRHLVDDKGNCVRMRGIMYGPHPFFNKDRWGTGWSNTSVKKCLNYFDKIFTALTDTTQGSYVNMWRVPWEEYWNVKPNVPHEGTDVSTWDEAQALKYLDQLFVPMIENAVSKGLYVVLRPTYGNPGTIQVGDDYLKHLCHEWQLLASHPRLQALQDYLSFELLNEPTIILDENGEETTAALAKYMQPMIDTIRVAGFKGIIWSSGLAFQSQFRNYLKTPVEDPLQNLGYAVHVYPGWYCQDDNTANNERFASSFKYNVPVLDESPILVTEVDWSPAKEGEGKYNEFGEWVASNYGTWGTGSTSKYGMAYKYVLDTFKNVSTLIGSAEEWFDIDQYLKDGTVNMGLEGNPETSAYAGWQWFNEWAHEPAVTPAELDRQPDELEPNTTLNTVEQLTENLFQMVCGSNTIFYLNTADMGGWDMMYGQAKTIVNQTTTAYLFKAHPIEIDGQTYYQLKCYNADGTLRLSSLDGGNGDGVNITTGANPALFIGSTRENGPFAYGQDLENGSIWDIQPKGKGFTFRNISTNRKYIGTSGQSSSAVIWKCYSRYSFLNNPPTGISDTPCLTDKEQMTNDKIYDLQGRRITGKPLQRGIYIVNGKKFIKQ